MRILVTGDREWTNKKRIYDLLVSLPKDTVIIHGRARGADTLAAKCALELGLQIDKPPTTTDRNDPAHLGGYPAEWNKYRRAHGRNPAGPIRNGTMIKEGLPDVTWAFHNNLDDSKGTKDCINQSIVAGLLVTLYTDTTATQIAAPITQSTMDI